MQISPSTNAVNNYVGNFDIYVKIIKTIKISNTFCHSKYINFTFDFQGVHKDAKTNKGHHDKENHLDKYDDHGGIDKHHHKEDKHYGSHHHEEHGKKHAKVCQVWLQLLLQHVL